MGFKQSPDLLQRNLKVGEVGRVGVGTPENLEPEHELEVESTLTTKPVVNIKNTNADANGAELRLTKEGGSAADNDSLGTISFYGEDSIPASTQYAVIQGISADITDDHENGQIIFSVQKDGVLKEVARLNPESTTADAFMGGFGYRRPFLEVTTATYTVGANQSGVILGINRAAGCTVTLPADTNVGFHCKLVLMADFSGTFKVATNAHGDYFFGGITIVSRGTVDSDSFAPAADSDNIVCDANTEGREAGGFLEFTLLATNKWLVSGLLVSKTAGAPTTPFATS
jgi:hypothetical protein